MNGPAPHPGTVPVGPLLTMYDPIYIGVDEFRQPVYTRVIYKNLLAAGEPGSGKSGLLNIFAAHAALSAKSRLVLFDGKVVELGLWADVADEFVGYDPGHAIITLRRLQKVMNNRYAWLGAHKRRKIEPFDDVSVITIIFDEFALYSTVVGTEAQQREFIALFRHLIARGRAAAMPSSPPPNGPRWTSSPSPSGTYSATAPRSAAPPPAAATSSSATAGLRPAWTPPRSAPPPPGWPT
jgi:DNA segregation ATPase FtsK/SpoIIIE, S-DNA-T family